MLKRLSGIRPNFFYLVLFRVLNALVVDTYFNPDEFWQGPEVAHNMVFGYGHLTWEWRARAKLRGAAHPFLFFAIPYKMLALLGLDSPALVAYLPRVIQGVVAAVGDYYTYYLALKIFGRESASWALFCSVCSWFNFFCTVRTFSNSVESVVTVVSLFHWPLGAKRGAGDQGVESYVKALFFAGFAVILRPTSGVVWVYIALTEMVGMRNWIDRFNFVLKLALPMAFGLLLLSLAIDRVFYGEWTFVIWNFLEFNVFKGLDKLYGTHPFYWYFTEGFTTVLGVFVPFLLHGIRKAWALPREDASQRDAGFGDPRVLGYAMLWAMIIYSFGGHKEFRFVLPLLPMALVYCGYALDVICRAASKWKEKSPSPAAVQWGQRSVAVIVAVNAVMAAYLSFVHQKSPISVMRFLRNEGISNSRDLKRVHFLMPCHSTPYYSHLHRNVPMWFIDCSPPYMVEPPSARRDLQQVKYFERNPLAFVNEIYSSVEKGGETDPAISTEGVWVKWKHHELPSHMVTFDSFERSLLPFFQRHGYEKVTSLFHSHLKGDADASEHHGYASIWYRKSRKRTG